MSRPGGFRHSQEARLAISEGVRKAYADGRMPRKRGYQPPDELRVMYVDFVHRFGRKEARRLIEDHAAAVRRRLATSRTGP